MSVPGFLPEDCGDPGNVGTGDPAKEAMLLDCAEAAIGDPSCEWYVEAAEARVRRRRGRQRAQRQARGPLLASRARSRRLPARSSATP